MSLLRIAILISGTGTNMEAFFEGLRLRRNSANVVFVGSDKKTAKGLATAKNLGAEPSILTTKRDALRVEKVIADTVKARGAEWIILAGFMRILSPEFALGEFSGKIINIHPALLPAFPRRSRHSWTLGRREFPSQALQCTLLTKRLTTGLFWHRKRFTGCLKTPWKLLRKEYTARNIEFIKQLSKIFFRKRSNKDSRTE